MRKALLGISMATAVFLSGCASNGMAVNTMGGNRVDRSFIEGRVMEQKKVIIADTELAALTGAGIGAAGGMAVGGIANGGKGAVTGGLFGALAGAATGALVGKEVEAYATSIKGDDKQIYNGYVAHKLNDGQCVEFTVVDGKLKNMNTVTCKMKNIQGIVTSIQKEGDVYAYNIKTPLEDEVVYFDKGYVEFKNCRVNVLAHAKSMDVIKIDKGECIKPQPQTKQSPVKKESKPAPVAAAKPQVEEPKPTPVVEIPQKPSVAVQETVKQEAPVAVPEKKSKYEF